MTENRTVKAPSRRRNILLAAAIVVVALLAASVTTWWLSDGRERVTRASWQPPPDALLSSSMQEQPVPGWHVAVTDLGIPETPESRLAISNDPRGPRPLVGYRGSRAYFLARSGDADDPQWWLTGLDAHDGRPMFPAVRLAASTRAPECFLNGPSDILCIHDLTSPSAWVIDGNSGALLYSGPTDLRLGFSTLAVKQVGNYAIATTADQGVYGIGSRSETTWFVPGDGDVSVRPAGAAGAGAQILSAQHAGKSTSRTATIFSVVDGKPVRPEVDGSAAVLDATFYTGGFAAAVAGRDGVQTGVRFFNDVGKRVGEHPGLGDLDTDDPVDLPVVSTDSGSVVYSAEGDELITVPSGSVELVGTTLMVNTAKSRSFPEWQQYDLRTGAAGQKCDFPMQNYLGTDGKALVFEVSNRSAGVLAKGFELLTCRQLWSLPKKPDSLDRVLRIGDALVQVIDDGTQLTSLSSPG